MLHMNVLDRTGTGISVSMPSLPGCRSEGDTEDEVLENIRDAIREFVLSMEDLAPVENVCEVEVRVLAMAGIPARKRKSHAVAGTRGGGSRRTLPDLSAPPRLCVTRFSP